MQIDGESEGGMDSGEDRTFKVNFSEGGVEKLRESVRNKLKEFMGDYTDDTLVEYVIVLLRNGRRKEEAKSELNVFLGDDSNSFVSWLWDHLNSHWGDYGQNAVESRGLASRVRSVIAQLPVDNEKHERGGNISNDRRKRDWKGSVRDSTELSSCQSQDLEEVGHHSTTQGPSSPQEQRKRRRHDEPNSRKRDSAQPIIDAPRRLLQFAVRDAVENCRQTGAVKDPPARPCLRSVVSTSSESPPLTQQSRRIRSVAHVLPGMSTVFKAVHEAAEDVKKVRSRKSVFDRLGRDRDIAEIRDHITQFRDENTGDGLLEECNQVQGQLLKSSYIMADEIIANDAGLASASTSDSEGHNDVNNRHIRVSNISQRVKHNDLRETVTSSPNGFMHANDDTQMARNEENSGAFVPNNSVKAVNNALKTSTQPSMKYLRPREDGEMISKQNVLPSSVHMMPESVDSEAVKCVTDVQSESQKLSSNTAAFPAGRPSEDVDSRTLFVSNVNFSATKDGLSRHFNKFGEVLKVNIVTDATTRQPIGSAYVEFMRKEAADNALCLDGSIFLSRKLRVLRKSAAHQEPGSSSSWPRVPARGSPYTTARFPRSSFPRGSPGRYRTPLKPRMRSFQWKRGDPQAALSDSGPLPQTPRSLTYIRSHSKPDGNLGIL